jgi:hypothetical protein
VSIVRGFFPPKTATGRAALVPPPPWYYSGDLLTIEYRTDPVAVAALLPEPLRLADSDPGAVALIWADWQSCSESRAELLDPVRAQYRECFVVRCMYEGRVYSRCVYIWVDRDFAVIEPGGGLELDELVSSGAASFEGGVPWAGEASLALFDAPTEELASLAVEEPIGAYYRQVGVCWNGGSVLASGTSGAE